jgi:UDP-N-acetylglucosamine diphosphorylase/glucosamine-1-phosphate N-acetyltransferase
MNVVLFDNGSLWKEFLPLTYTRPLSEIRFGILTIKEKWDKFLKTNCSYYTQDFLAIKFHLKETANSLFIASHVCPDAALVKEIGKLKKGEALVKDKSVIAFIGSSKEIGNTSNLSEKNYSGNIFQLERTWDIFKKADAALRMDFDLLTKKRKSAPISKTVRIIGKRSNVFFEKGVHAEACIINAGTGPVYIAKDAEIMEGSAIRGPFSLGEHSTLKLNTKVYGATVIGAHCKVGGEISNSVIFGYSNKAHDGFIGNTVIGEWCNLGADTNTSNLKNNYADVKLFSYALNKQIDSGQQFVGTIMGDHSKTGINTMLNTGTVVGVGANTFGGGFPPTHIPSFTWGGANGVETYKIDKMFETAEKVFERRGIKFNAAEKEMLRHIFSITAGFRND